MNTGVNLHNREGYKKGKLTQGQKWEGDIIALLICNINI